MAEWWLDYSAAKLSGATIKATAVGPAGERAIGVIRYIDAPDRLRTKHTNLTEYRDHVANGLQVRLVMQNTTTDADSGFAGGVANAKRALAGANYLGYTGPIFFCNDRTTVPNPAAWQSYLDGAASVLGIGRVGAYGFYNALDLAKGHASYFWQAGRRSDVRAHTHAWQDNNTQVTVGGITCDRNLILKPIGGSAAAEDDMYTFKDLFYDNPVQEFGNFSQLLAEVKEKARAAAADAASAKADLATVKGALAALDAKVSGGGVSVPELAEEVAALLGPALAKAVADEQHKRLAE